MLTLPERIFDAIDERLARKDKLCIYGTTFKELLLLDDLLQAQDDILIKLKIKIIRKTSKNASLKR